MKDTLTPPGNEEQQPVRTITKEQYWAARGLAECHAELKKDLEVIEGLIAKSVGESREEGSGNYYGHVSDSLWEGTSVDEMLERLKIKVINVPD